MALDPKKWTVKTQEAFAAALDLARTNANPELTPDHMLSVLAGRRHDPAALLGKLGQPPLMVKNCADEAITKLPSARGATSRTFRGSSTGSSTAPSRSKGP